MLTLTRSPSFWKRSVVQKFQKYTAFSVSVFCVLLVSFFSACSRTASVPAAPLKDCGTQTSPTMTYNAFRSLYNSREYGLAFTCLVPAAQTRLLRSTYASAVLLSEFSGKSSVPISGALSAHGIKRSVTGNFPPFEQLDLKAINTAGLFEDLTFAGLMVGGQPAEFGEIQQMKEKADRAAAFISVKKGKVERQLPARFAKIENRWFFEWFDRM